MPTWWKTEICSRMAAMVPAAAGAPGAPARAATPRPLPRLAPPASAAGAAPPTLTTKVLPLNMRM
jgi:hypothetical protein